MCESIQPIRQPGNFWLVQARRIAGRRAYGADVRNHHVHIQRPASTNVRPVVMAQDRVVVAAVVQVLKIRATRQVDQRIDAGMP